MRKVAFYTLGCKVNQYDTEAVLENFKSAGYEVVDFSEYADVYVVNTCTVTHLSDRKCRQILRKTNKPVLLAVNKIDKSRKYTCRYGMLCSNRSRSN